MGDYKSVYIDLVISAFMLIAGANFSLHYFAMTRGDVKGWARTRSSGSTQGS